MSDKKSSRADVRRTARDDFINSIYYSAVTAAACFLDSISLTISACFFSLKR